MSGPTVPGQAIAEHVAQQIGAPGAVELPLSEVFGPTWQGEGPATGRRCWFVRLGLCNLSCEWCDTPYTWDTSRFNVKAECPDTPVDAIAARLADLGAGAVRRPLVILSGGEPLLHHLRLPALLDAFPAAEWHVETNGTIPPPPWWADRIAHTTVSPKVITRSDPSSKRIKNRALAQWAELARQGRATLKFVLATQADVLALVHLTSALGIEPELVWVMPEGTTPDAVLRHHRDIADAALAAGFNTTTRLHTLLWGDERGH